MDNARPAGRISRSKAKLFLVISVLLAPAALARAQTYSPLYNFSGGSDGGFPMAGLTMDAAGNFYGTTQYGGSNNCNAGCGTVFKLTRHNSSWALSTLYEFTGLDDGSGPIARVVFGPDGALYGTTNGGAYPGRCCGAIFRLTPPAHTCASTHCPWHLQVLYKFQGEADGGQPGAGDLIFDQDGSIYGTTENGGQGTGACITTCGTVFKLMKSGGVWTESVLHAFDGYDGSTPVGGVVFDHAGNLYGTTAYGGDIDLPSYFGTGVVFKLSPGQSGWTETIIYTMQDTSGDGGLPYSALTPDPRGGFYADTYAGGGGGDCLWSQYSGCGSVFQTNYLGWFFTNLSNGGIPPTGLSGPRAPLTVDASANAYGTTYADGENGYGTIFKIRVDLVDHFPIWTYQVLYNFSGDTGSLPVSNVTFDSQGNMYGTSSKGGSGPCNDGVYAGCGVIWERSAPL
jgi:hypothetical protein